jgi:RecJ-like exonuclease
MSLAEILVEIHKLTATEQAELRARLNAEVNESGSADASRFLEQGKALQVGRDYMTRHAELFRKLAQ